MTRRGADKKTAKSPSPGREAGQEPRSKRQSFPPRPCSDEPPRAADVLRTARSSFAWPALAVLLGLLCYVNSLFNGFTYDDLPIIEQNPRIRSLTNFREIWLTDWWFEQTEDQPFPNPERDRLYRPLTLFSFAVNYAVHGLQPAGYHAVNVALHAAVCFLVWLFVRRLFEDEWIAGLTAVLFAVHPIHVEAVTGIVGRGEILAAGFLILGLLILLPRAAPPSATRLWLSLPFLLAALLAKETAVCYPAVGLIVVHAVYGFKRITIGGWLWRTAILLLPLIIYLPLRYYAMGGHLIRTKLLSVLFVPLRDADWFGRIHGPLTILGHYARLILVPDKLACDYGPAVFDPRQGPELLTAVGLLMSIGLLIALSGYFRGGTAGRRVAVLALLFLASYILISNTVLLIGISIADRLMYWPSVPLLAAVAIGVAWFRDRYRARAAAAPDRAAWIRLGGVLLIAALALRTVVRNTDWKDNATLFTTDLQTYPRNAFLNNAMAGRHIWDAHRLSLRINEAAAAVLNADPPLEEEALARESREIERLRAERDVLLEEAERLGRRALEVEQRFPEALVQLGKIAVMRGDDRTARRYLENGLLLNPGDAVARQLLARLSGADEELKARAAELERGFESRTDFREEDAPALLELARTLLSLGQAARALRYTDVAARLAPGDAEILKIHAESLLLNIQRDQAREVYERVLELAPNDWEAHSNLATLLSERDPAGTLRHALRAYELRPDDLRIQMNLAEAYALNGRRGEAVSQFRRSLRNLSANHPQRELILSRIAELERMRP